MYSVCILQLQQDVTISSAQFSHFVVSDSLRPRTAAAQASVYHQLPEFTQTYSNISMESVMSANHLILCHLLVHPAFNLAQHQGFFK